MQTIIARNKLRKRRHKRVRGKVFGNAKKPRLSIFFSLRYVYAQIIDDDKNQVIAEANSKDLVKKSASKEKGKTVQAAEIGKLVAERAIGKGIKKVVFDRSGYAYHGKVKTLADAARKAGLKF
jgi:large subunit ribosomal protein L18